MDDLWDIICVGAGSAGLPLAIQAAGRSARILQIEADSRVGGTLYWSSGQIAAAGTRLQREHGIADSPDEHYADAQRIAHDTIDPVVLRLFVDNAAGLLDWLMDLGFKPAPGTPVAGEAHEPYRTRRYQWGTQAALSILDVLRPVHEALVNEGKIDLRLGHRMRKLTTDHNGAVNGVEVEAPGGKVMTFRGRNVVLATGGYACGPDVWAELTPQFPLCSYANPYSRGDGILAARDLGARVDGSEKYLNTFAGLLERTDDPRSGTFLLLSPNKRSVWEIFIDASGKRFMREDHPSIDYRERALLRQPGTAMTVLYDEGIRQNAPTLFVMPPADVGTRFGNHQNYLMADTLEDLARQLDVSPATLRETVEAYNQAVRSGNDAAFGRHFLIREIATAPFYAVRAQGITVVSPAGVAVDSDLRVLRGDGQPIPNLYAAGEVLGFTRNSGNAFVGGLSLTPALTFGKLLGERVLRW